MPPSDRTTSPRIEAVERLRQLGQPSAATAERAGLLAAQETTSTRGLSPEAQNRLTLVDRLRQKGDELINETLANNPLQRAAAPILSRTGDALRKVNIFGGADDPTNALDLLENIGKGAAVGSILIPDDAAVDPENPIPALQLASTFVSAGAEGASFDLGILRGLNMVRGAAQARNAKNLASSANKALRAFGQGEDLSTFRQILGGGALAGTSEIALRSATLQDPAEILQAAGLVAVGGAALGGAVATVSAGRRAALATPRALKSFSEGFAEKAAPELQEATARSADFNEMSAEVTEAVARDQAEFDITAKQGVGEEGVHPRTEYISRAEDTARRLEAVENIRRAPEAEEGRDLLRSTGGRTQSAKIEAIMEPQSGQRFIDRLREGFAEAGEAFRDAFQYEARLQDLPSTTGYPDLSAADDIRVLQHGIQRSDRLAAKDVSNVIAPLRSMSREDLTPAWRQFERIVVLRDFAETAEKGLDLPLGLDRSEVQRELARLESAAPKPVLEAAENHRSLVKGWKEEMIRRGDLEVGDGYEDYFPHQVVEDLATEDARISGLSDPSEMRNAFPTSSAIQRGKLREPSRPYTRQRLGSEKPIRTNYIDVMHSAGRRFHADNLIKDYLDEVGESALRLRRSDLTQDELSDLLRRGVFKREGRLWTSFKPKGRAYYRTNSVDDEAFNTLRNKIQDEVGIDIEDMPELREVLAVGKPKEYILPKDLADRLDQFYEPDPLTLKGTAPIKRAVHWWKRNTIFWGLMRFSVFQILGDGTNLLRSNPAAFAQIRKGRINSPLLKAVKVQFAKYGTPMMSKEQLFGQMTGGVGGLAINEALSEDDPDTFDRVASFLAGAGLGYIVGTHRVVGSRPREGLASLYDEADRMAAINSGFVFSEEELSKRILGEKSAALPDQRSPSWRRAMDSFVTLLTGKARGDAFAPFEIPARTLEVFQRERENTMRLASYIQQVEDGVSGRVAAKRARESLVDYGKFSQFENKILRGFALPFYAFHRHNIPNWVKAALKKDVGGKPTVAMAAVGTLAAADLSTQLWNETFFPEVEQSLPKYQRDRFHIIVGNPVTRTPYTDKDGNAMVVGWEMPYEQALEFFGLARPGVIYSEMFGMGGLENRDFSLVEQAKKSAEDVALLRKGPGKLALDLLNPFLKEAAQITANKDFFFDAPIVPQRYFNNSVLENPTARKEVYEHVGETFFRQYREFKRIGGRIKGNRFDPLTSAVGLGLPVSRVSMDRNLQGFIHEQIDAAVTDEIAKDAKWKSEIDDILYQREDFAQPEEGELQEVVDMLNGMQGLTQNDIEQARRYYMSRGGKGSLVRRWESLSSEEKARVFNQLPEWGRTALVGYLNFGSSWIEEGAPGAGGLNITGGLN